MEHPFKKLFLCPQFFYIKSIFLNRIILLLMEDFSLKIFKYTSNNYFSFRFMKKIFLSLLKAIFAKYKILGQQFFCLLFVLLLFCSFNSLNMWVYYLWACVISDKISTVIHVFVSLYVYSSCLSWGFSLYLCFSSVWPWCVCVCFFMFIQYGIL